MRRSCVGKVIKVVKNMASNTESYAQGEEGVIMSDSGSSVMVRLRNFKKFPVPYIFDKRELKIGN